MDSGLKSQQELEKIEQQIQRLETLEGQSEETRRQIQQLHQRVNDLRREVSSHLNAWERTEVARHPQRPYTLDYIERIFTDWSEIHGDRGFADDPAIVCGMARFHGEEVLIVGHQKARDTKQKVYRNFGMPNPEGYRKALRAMQIAAKFRRPIFTFVDTPGAYPGLGAEERGQAEAIAYNLREMARLEVPIVVTVTGEGGSGGALAIAVGDRVLMMENSIYSVISPEGCASIMWRDATKRNIAAAAMKITAKDLSELGIIDAIVTEPPGGAHTDHAQAAELLDRALQQHLADIKKLPIPALLDARYAKFRNMAQFFQPE
jgi:acetyl-CoA carboxylase carboxyl transferase subunit alpha